MASEQRIEGFVAGTTSITVRDNGAGVSIVMSNRAISIEEALSVAQSARLRRLLTASEKRAREGQQR